MPEKEPIQPYPPITNIITTFSVFFTGCRMLNKVPVAVDIAIMLSYGFIAALFFGLRGAMWGLVRNLVNERRKIRFATQQRLDTFENPFGFALGTNSLESCVPRFLA